MLCNILKIFFSPIAYSKNLIIFAAVKHKYYAKHVSRSGRGLRAGGTHRRPRALSVTVPDQARFRGTPTPVSYTHLDVYKRQEQCIEEKAGKTDQNGIELVNTTSRNGRMEIWLFNIGRSVHAYLRNVPISSRKNHHTSLPA